PEGQREAEPLVVVGEARQAIFAPAVSAGSGLVVGEVVPRVPALAVILTDRPPLPFAEVRAPFLPRSLLPTRLLEFGVLGGHGRTCSCEAEGWCLRQAFDVSRYHERDKCQHCTKCRCSHYDLKLRPSLGSFDRICWWWSASSEAATPPN